MKYSYDDCYNIAKNYTEKGIFREENRYVYDKAYREGWLKDYIWLENKKKIYKKVLF